jgi:hypothetical protein
MVEDGVYGKDNVRAMPLEKNGRSSAAKQSRHSNIWYFFTKDWI